MIVLITDFGLKDEYVAEMKASIKYIEPSVEIIDLTHFVEPGNIKHGQFFLKYSYRFFPKNTIFVAVVDPGVGGDRREITIRYKDRWFIAPDNGLLGFVEDYKAYEITGVKNPLTKEVSNTFHGRDIFSPAAAYLYQGRGEYFSEIENINNSICIKEITEPDNIEGEILHIDNFGNIITNISNTLFNKIQVKIKKRDIAEYATNFEEGRIKGYNLFITKGSKGLLEIVSYKAKASEILKTKIGEKIKVKIKEV